MSLKTVSEIVSAVKSKKAKPSEIAQQHLENIRERNPDLNAVISFNEPAIEDLDKLVDQFPEGRLLGVPILLKDLICSRGDKTTAGSKMLQNFVSPYDATLVKKLRSEGAVILGKCNLDEFAMGSSNETSFFGACKNPWNKEFVPGGSSGGSAVSVAAEMAPLSIGTDTGGSIRQPASFCGVVGIKPTYGRVSRFGVIAYASSLDQAGPLSKTVLDGIRCLEVMAGEDPSDGTSSDQAVPGWEQNLKVGLKGRKIAVVDEMLEVCDAEVRECFDQQIEKSISEGAVVQRVSCPLLKTALPVYYLIAMSEASSNLSRYDGVRFGHQTDTQETPVTSLADFYQRNRSEGFGEEVKRRIVMGTFALSSGYYDAYYEKASRIRRLIKEEMSQIFRDHEVILSPTSASLPFRVGEKIADPLAMIQNDKLTTFANLAGLPSLSLPMGLSQEGLPIGLQVTSQAFNEQAMFDVASGLEQIGDPIGLPGL